MGSISQARFSFLKKIGKGFDLRVESFRIKLYIPYPRGEEPCTVNLRQGKPRGKSCDHEEVMNHAQILAIFVASYRIHCL